MEKVLELRNLGFCYNGNKKAVIRGINYTFEAGTLYVIQGMSGCGKTNIGRASCRERVWQLV